MRKCKNPYATREEESQEEVKEQLHEESTLKYLKLRRGSKREFRSIGERK